MVKYQRFTFAIKASLLQSFVDFVVARKPKVDWPEYEVALLDCLVLADFSPVLPALHNLS